MEYDAWNPLVGEVKAGEIKEVADDVAKKLLWVDSGQKDEEDNPIMGPSPIWEEVK